MRSSLGEWGTCPICKSRGFLGGHCCPPSCEVCWFGNEDEPSIIYADDEEDAVCTFSSRNCEYDSGPFEVSVRKDEDSEWQVFEVSVEAVPHFSAEKSDKVVT